MTERFGDLWGTSPPMQAVFSLLERVAPSDLAVVLLGETGTGKELASRALHARGSRANGPFVVVDCGAIQANLIESELFGHERGAFTGAERQRRGAFETANRGTVFLDEIGELPLVLQPKLLRVLERREVQRLGASDLTRIDVRVVSATHRDLRGMVKRGTFREDLYFRLAEMEINLPPLRDRLEDVPLMSRIILDELHEAGGPEVTITPEAMARLTSRAWPGNVRELRNLLRRAAVMAEGARIDVPDVELDGTPSPPASLPAIEEDMTLKAAREAWNETLERQYLERTLERFGGDLQAAADHAGMHRKSFERLLRRHALKV